MIIKEGADVVPYTRVGIYGEPKSGKTRLATSLPWGTHPFGDKAVYVAWDPGAAALESVGLPDRSHLIKVQPGEEGALSMDPVAEAVKIASFPWRKETGADNLIWDTMSVTAEDILKAIASSGTKVNKAHDQPMAIGVRGTDTYVAQPALADYGAAQFTIFHILDFLFNQDLNIFVLFHAHNDDQDGKADMLGGPSTIGGVSAIRKIAKRFDNLFRITIDRAEKRPRTIPPQYVTQRVVQTDRKGYWLAGLRAHTSTNPMPIFNIEGDNVRSFWLEFSKARGVTNG